MTEVALVAECSNHHPEWGNIYNRITVQLTTHDAGGITEKDFDLAHQMNSIASRRSQEATKLEPDFSEIYVRLFLFIGAFQQEYELTMIDSQILYCQWTLFIEIET